LKSFNNKHIFLIPLRLVNKEELVRKTSELLNFVVNKGFEGQLVKEDSSEFRTILDYLERD
jgi:hypothetical protein